MQFQIPVSTLFTQVFGIAQPFIRKFDVSLEEEPTPSPKYNLIPIEEDDQDVITSVLGTPIQFPMAFDGSREFKYLLNGEIKKKFLPGCFLPYTSIATFSRAKRITETFMSGHKGSVIEQFGFEPWSIKIQGFIIKGEKALTADSTTYSVADQVKQLQEYEELSDEIGVRGKVFEWLKIHKVAIISITYPEARDLDMTVIKPYEMNLRSVEPIELVEI